MSFSKERKDKKMGRRVLLPNEANLASTLSDNNMAECVSGFFYFKLFLSCSFHCDIVFKVFSTSFTHFVESFLKYILTLTCSFSFVRIVSKDQNILQIENFTDFYFYFFTAADLKFSKKNP